MWYAKAKALVPGASNNLVSNWVIKYAIFLHELAQQWRLRKKKWHKDSLGDQDDARTSNTHIAQRNRAIPHWTMKNTFGANQ